MPAINWQFETDKLSRQIGSETNQMIFQSGWNAAQAGAQFGNDVYNRALQNRRLEMDQMQQAVNTQMAARELQIRQAESTSRIQTDQVERAMALENLRFARELHTTDMIEYQKQDMQMALEERRMRLEKMRTENATGGMKPPLTRREMYEVMASGKVMEYSNGSWRVREATPPEIAAGKSGIEELDRYETFMDIQKARGQMGEAVDLGGGMSFGEFQKDRATSRDDELNTYHVNIASGRPVRTPDGKMRIPTESEQKFSTAWLRSNNIDRALMDAYGKSAGQTTMSQEQVLQLGRVETMPKDLEEAMARQIAGTNIPPGVARDMSSKIIEVIETPSGLQWSPPSLWRDPQALGDVKRILRGLVQQEAMNIYDESVKAGSPISVNDAWAVASQNTVTDEFIRSIYASMGITHK